MIGEEIKDTLKEVTVEELRKITWDYSVEDIVGLHNDNIVRRFLWEAIECGNVDSRTITKCNVVEGWVEHIEVEYEKPSYNLLDARIKRTEDGEAVKTKVNCKVVVDLLDAKGNIIVTLR